MHKVAAVIPTVFQPPDRHLLSSKNGILFHIKMSQVSNRELSAIKANEWSIRKTIGFHLGIVDMILMEQNVTCS